jgi:hypothetical protein
MFAGCAKRAIGAVLIALSLVSTPLAALAENLYPLGDTGIPENYNDTMLRFQDAMPDFLARAAALPSAFDWRSSGKVTSAKNQQDCGGCWSFASTGSLESKLLIQGLGSYDLSEQQQISCNTSMSGCSGGSMASLQYWYSTGPMLESCTGYPSSGGSTGSCSTISSCATLPYRTTGYYTVDTSNYDEVKTSLVTHGPTYFRFNVYSDFYTFWNSGSSGQVYSKSSGTNQGGHAILLIGWDDSKSAWLLKNSWGATGGPNGDGTFWMAYSDYSATAFGMANTQYAGATPSSTQPDILWRKNTGQTGVWKLYLTTAIGWASSTTVSNPWQIQGTGDFNNDGKTDVLWRNPNNGKTSLVYMNGASWSGTPAALDTVPAPWRIYGTGDFNSDGYVDIVWRNPNNGRTVVMYMQGSTKLSTADISQPGTGYALAGVGDLNADGKPDLLWRSGSTTTVWFMNGTSKSSEANLQDVESVWRLVGCGDFNQDGKVDVLWRHTQIGRNTIMLLNGTTTSSFANLVRSEPSTGWEPMGVGVFH